VTTRNINGINAARRAVSATAESARARHQRLAEEAAALVAQRAEDDANFEIARRASEQEHNDRLGEIGEELGQTGYVVDGAELEPADPEPPVAPPAPPEEPGPAAPPIPPAPPEEPAVPAPEPQQALGLPAAQVVPAPPRNHFNPRNWGRLEWLLAVVLGLFGLFIGLRTVEWVVSDWNVGWPDWIVVTIQAIFGFAWVIALAGLGFFGGALIGFFAPRWRERRRARLVAANQPPPAA